MQKNLYEETDSFLKLNYITWEDVRWVADCDGELTLERFIELAKATNYDNGLGAQEISPALVIVGNNWWLSRREYDGSEWWEFNKRPARPKQKAKAETLANYRDDEGEDQ